MNVPTGYTELDMVGFTDKGTYSASAEYVKNDIVHYGNALWRCKIDETTGVTPAENTNWTLYINAADTLAAMTARDTSGIIGTPGATVNAQNLIDALAAGAAGIENFAPAESQTAAAAHAVGTYLTYNNTLYKVTTAIAIGDTLTPGTNISSTTVGEEIEQIRAVTDSFSIVNGELCITYYEEV